MTYIDVGICLFESYAVMYQMEKVVVTQGLSIAALLVLRLSAFRMQTVPSQQKSIVYSQRGAQAIRSCASLEV